MTSTQPAMAPVPSAALNEATDQRPDADRSFARLKRLGTVIERRAAHDGATVEFLGVEPLFSQPRIYAETTTPWVLCPAGLDPLVQAGIPIPAAQQRQLDAILETGMDFPHLYLAHEIPGKARQRPTPHPKFDSYRVLSTAETKELVGRPAAPAASHRTATRLDQIARSLGRGIRATAIGAGAALASPLLLFDGLDPAILGAVTLPSAGHAPGTPAAWFLLARWDW